MLTALAISGDLIGRMARNHPLASFGAFGCAAMAVFLGAVAAYGLQEGSHEERGVVAAGILVLGGALVFGVYAGVATWGDRAQPSITVTPKSGSLVAVSVHGIGLRSTDHIVVEVEQLLHTSGGAGHESWERPTALRSFTRPEQLRRDRPDREPRPPGRRLRRRRRTCLGR